MRAGRSNTQKTIEEWVGPRCSKLGINMSMSGKVEARNRRGMFAFTFRSFDEVLPDRYPRAKCPTENIFSSLLARSLTRLYVFRDLLVLIGIKSHKRKSKKNQI